MSTSFVTRKEGCSKGLTSGLYVPRKTEYNQKGWLYFGKTFNFFRVQSVRNKNPSFFLFEKKTVPNVYLNISAILKNKNPVIGICPVWLYSERHVMWVTAYCILYCCCGRSSAELTMFASSEWARPAGCLICIVKHTHLLVCLLFFFLIPRFNSTRRVLFMPYGRHAAEFTGTSLGVSSLLFGQWCQDLMYPYGYLRFFSIIIFPEDSNLASFCTVHWNVFT